VPAPVDHQPEIVGRPVVDEHVRRQPAAVILAGLRRDPAADLGLTHAACNGAPHAQLERRLHRHHGVVHAVPEVALSQDRHVEHDHLSTEPSQPIGELGVDGRMADGCQPVELERVGEHDGTEGSAVDGAEGIEHGVVRPAAGLEHDVAQGVDVDDRRSQLLEATRRGRLPGTDASGEADHEQAPDAMRDPAVDDHA
jgi:hypothetical protein